MLLNIVQGVSKVAVHSLIQWKTLQHQNCGFDLHTSVALVMTENVGNKFWHSSKHICYQPAVFSVKQ